VEKSEAGFSGSANDAVDEGHQLEAVAAELAAQAVQPARDGFHGRARRVGHGLVVREAEGRVERGESRLASAQAQAAEALDVVVGDGQRGSDGRGQDAFM
jgi:hypothetical protein